MIPQLRTERLTLRPLRADDVAALTDGINDYEVSKWLTVVPFPYGKEDAAWFVGECEAGRELAWGIALSNAPEAVLGVIGGGDSFGYWLRRSAWGQGIMSEAAPAVLAHVFSDPGVDGIRSEYFDGNARSCAILTGLGFAPTGERMAHSKARGEEVLSHQLWLSRAAWEQHAPRP